MTIGIVSMIRDAWGGSEELWYAMAKEALSKGIKIIHVGYETPKKHAKMLELEALGMRHIDRPGWIPYNAEPVKKTAYLGWNFIRKKINSPFKKLFKLKPDIVIYNGTCYSVANETELLSYVQNNSCSFYIIGQLNFETLRNISDVEAEKIRKAYSLSKEVFFVSKRNVIAAERHLCTEIENAIVIRNPVNLTNISKMPMPPFTETIQMACVGNLVTMHKGQDILFEALAQLNCTNWSLNIYGEGYDKEYLQTLAKYLKIKDKIIFHGTVRDIRAIWARNHVLLMPSHMEGMPLAVVEAMLCGRICIATDVGGIAEWITHSVNGFVAEAPTVNSLLKTLKEAMSVKEQWLQMSDEAHKAALQLYDPNAGATLLNRIIAE